MNIELNNIYGDFPNKSCVFAACDSKYFIDHASPFINSVHKVGKPLHIHIINPTNEVFDLVKRYKEKISTPLSFTYNNMDMPENQDQMKCIYSLVRFFILPHLLEKIEKVMILDIDCMVMRDFEFPKTPCGLFVRQPVTHLTDWIKEGTKIAAGIVYFDNTFIDRSKKLIEIINSLPKIWYADQVALNKLLVEHIDYNDVTVFDNHDMDWDFLDGTVIWTGKGNRKYDNSRYVAMKKSMRI